MKLSIVLASHNARAAVAPCLAQLQSQIEHSRETVEIIVVDNSTDGTASVIENWRDQMPALRHLAAASDALIPQLWQIGIAQGAGEIVALSTTHCVPAPDWIAQILRAHDAPHAGIGGAIECAPRAGLVQWAIYFCRYSAFMPPFAPRAASDIAADNASYKKAALDACAHTWREGFWEPAVHACLRENGETLWVTPAIVVAQQRSFSLRGFLANRFRHGQQFGGERAARFGPFKRALYALASPLIPALFLFRIARQVLSKGRHRAQFWRALPVTILFLLSWSAGEFRGYCAPPRRS